MNQSNHLIEYIKWRISRNKNFMCAFTGPTGSGKTYSALKMAELLDPEFTVKDRVAYTPERFMEIVNEGNLKRGSVVLFEEAGVAINNRKWQSKENLVVNFVAQTFRHKNYIVIFTAPDFGFVDKATRKMFHCVCETYKIDHQKKLCIVKPLFIQVNQRSGKMYFKYMKWRGIKIARVGFGLVSKKMLEDYEKSKVEFTTELNKALQETLEKNKAKDVKKFPQWRCNKCEHSWQGKSMKRPVGCPSCGSKTWFRTDLKRSRIAKLHSEEARAAAARASVVDEVGL